MATIAKVEVTGTVIVWNWTDGKRTEFGVMDLPEEMVWQAAVHGIKQKGSDCYAGAAKEGMSVAECRELTEEVLDNIKNGNWNRKATGTGGIIVEAMTNLSGKERTEVVTFWKGLTEEQQKAMAKNKNVKAEVARLRAERAAEAAKGKKFKLDI